MTAKRRVLIIVENLPVPFDRRVWNEANTLKSAGYEVSIICPKGKDAGKSYENIDGINIYRHPLPVEARGIIAYPVEYITALFWELVLSIKVASKHGFDVIHACNPPDLIFLIGAVFKIFGKKFVFDHHDLNPELYEAKFGKRGLLYKLVVAAERLTFAMADMSIATNNSYRAIAIERGRMKSDEVFVVRSGPNLDRVRIQAPNLSMKNGRRFLVGYVGVMGAQEGIQYLLESARYIIYDLGRKDIQFVLVGGGPEFDNLQKLSSELGLVDFVTFTGRAPDEVLLDALNTADVCVNPEECNAMNDKSTMNKIMEYMALSKPVVQFDLAEGRFSAQEASLYAKWNDPIDFAQKILELLENPKLREEMGSFGRKRVEDELAWPHEAPKLLAAYDSLWK